MNWFIFILTSLAVFRLALMLSSEEGPMSAFSIMRRKVPAKTNPGRGIRCINCWGIWLAMAAGGYLWSIKLVSAQLLPIYICAVAGGAVLLNRMSKETT